MIARALPSAAIPEQSVSSTNGVAGSSPDGQRPVFTFGEKVSGLVNFGLIARVQKLTLRAIRTKPFRLLCFTRFKSDGPRRSTDTQMHHIPVPRHFSLCTPAVRQKKARMCILALVATRTSFKLYSGITSDKGKASVLLAASRILTHDPCPEHLLGQAPAMTVCT